MGIVSKNLSKEDLLEFIDNVEGDSWEDQAEILVGCLAFARDDILETILNTKSLENRGTVAKCVEPENILKVRKIVWSYFRGNRKALMALAHLIALSLDRPQTSYEEFAKHMDDMKKFWNVLNEIRDMTVERIEKTKFFRIWVMDLKLNKESFRVPHWIVSKKTRREQQNGKEESN